MTKFYFVRASYIVNRMCLQDTQVVKVEFFSEPTAEALQCALLEPFQKKDRQNVQLEQVTVL